MTANQSPRLPPIAPEDCTPEQKQAYDEFVATRGKHLADMKSPSVFAGPWSVFIRSPELMTLTQKMGEYLRYRCAISGRLSELAILLVARHWTADFEWYAHAKIAAREGLSDATIAAIREGRRPDDLKVDEQIIHDMVSELLVTRRVSDTSYDRAVKAFGEKGVVDICGVTGYYSLLAMSMNMARVSIPADGERLPRFPEA
ncbi:MAG: carboxymuconolactone decarboxylase family protein [Alphaproteobacteria bacterium]|nr:carboxymuconolactone decarboxylase family protein [Alphaproteobacteria bacterium]